MGEDDVRIIIARIRSGDRDAMGELVKRYAPRLRSVLSFYCSSAQEVEEMLQDAYIQAYTALGSYDDRQPFFPWLRAIALNLVRAEARRRSASTHHWSEYLRYIRMARAEEDPSGELATSRSEALRKCIGKLPCEQSELIRARYEKNEPLTRLASRLGATPGALKLRLLRLRQALRACIEKELALDTGERRT